MDSPKERRRESLCSLAGYSGNYNRIYYVKLVNDTFGHAYGDKVLALVGESLRHTFRAEDSLGRIGGDEFCVFMGIKDGMSAVSCTRWRTAPCTSPSERERTISRFTGRKPERKGKR